MKIYDDILQTAGNTPIIRLSRFSKVEGAGEILAKAEGFNPNGSVKDRVGIALIEAAEKSGELSSGGTVIEPTSGNTGIGLAMACAVKGYKLILTMPASMSVERRKLLAALGAQIVLTEPQKGMLGAIEKANELKTSIEGAYIPQQFENPANPAAHRRSTACEILRDTDGKIDFFVCGVGTGGTLTGVGEQLKKEIPALKVIAVEPKGSPLLSKGRTGAHGLQGIGANFVPPILNRDIIDEVIAVSEDEAYAAARLLGKTEGFTCGISGGAALHAAKEISVRNPGKTVLVLLPDGGEKYLSTPLFE